MIYQHDLYDIAKAFMHIRYNIQENSNIEILYAIISVLNKDQENSEDNQIRKALRLLKGLDSERWYYIFFDNVYTHHYLLKNKNIYKLFEKLCKETIALLEQNDYERAYDLVDAYHCLPEIIANNNFTIPKSFWKTFVKDYRSKWDNDFLRDEQRMLKRFQEYS